MFSINKIQYIYSNLNLLFDHLTGRIQVNFNIYTIKQNVQMCLCICDVLRNDRACSLDRIMSTQKWSYMLLFGIYFNLSSIHKTSDCMYGQSLCTLKLACALYSAVNPGVFIFPPQSKQLIQLCKNLLLCKLTNWITLFFLCLTSFLGWNIT